MSRTWSKIKNRTILVNKKILEEYSVKISEIDPYFYEHYRKNVQTDKNGSKYKLFRIDIYFAKYFLEIEIVEKGHTDKELLRKKIKSTRKKT